MARIAPTPRHVSIVRFLTAIAIAAACSVTMAQGASSIDNATGPAQQDLGTSVPDAAVVKEGLFPEDACAELRNAGYKCMGVKPAMTFSLPAAAFALGSATLPELLQRQLDVFAEVLGSKRGSDQKIKIVGHADASGTSEGNKLLSQRRANAVKAYLVAKGADSQMLVADGVGADDLKNPTNPTAPENRRVTLGR